MGLDDDTYPNVQSQILALDQLPSLDKIFNIVQQEENHKQFMIGRENRTENLMAFLIRDKAGGAKRSTYNNCGRYGHEEAACYKIIDYPHN